MVRTWWAACVMSTALAGSSCALAAEGDCPQLPEVGGLRWEQRALPDMVFCKAIGDEGELFSVTLGRSLPFRAVGSQQSGRGNISGHKVRWYRGSDGFDPDLLLRETLLKRGRGREAHVVVRARSEEDLAQRLQLAEQLRFDPEG